MIEGLTPYPWPVVIVYETDGWIVTCNNSASDPIYEVVKRAEHQLTWLTGRPAQMIQQQTLYWLEHGPAPQEVVEQFLENMSWLGRHPLNVH